MVEKEVVNGVKEVKYRNMSFVDRAGNIIYPSREHLSGEVATAYAFFHCEASKQEVERELPQICEVIGTPSDLELSLTEGTDNVQGDEPMRTLAQEAKKGSSNDNYMLMAKTRKGDTNRNVADILSSIINQAYQSPLYRENELFYGYIAFLENGRYVFRD